MAISKIILNGVTQMDLTSDTVAANNLISPNTAHGADGEPVVGTASGITPVTYTITIKKLVSGDTQNRPSIRVNGQTPDYYADNATVEIQDGDYIQFVFGSDFDGVVYVDGSSISPISGSYKYTPTSDLVVEMARYELNNSAIVYINTQKIPYGSTSITSNGDYNVGGYARANINVPTGTARSSSDLTASGATVTVPAGLYSTDATKAISSGTEGTPTATKGTVSNHSVTVTPSVTNTTGYITGGTKTGTAVSVSASELVSGTYTVDSSGTKDVTNYASASVPAGTAGTPSATKGAVSNHQVSVTPSVTNTTGWITGSTKNGTAVTVTASELASGNKAIVDNGTNIDVVGYSTVSVAVPFSTITVSSSNPTGGNNGDVWIKTS